MHSSCSFQIVVILRLHPTGASESCILLRNNVGAFATKGDGCNSFSRWQNGGARLGRPLTTEGAGALAVSRTLPRPQSRLYQREMPSLGLSGGARDHSGSSRHLENETFNSSPNLTQVPSGLSFEMLLCAYAPAPGPEIFLNRRHRWPGSE